MPSSVRSLETIRGTARTLSVNDAAAACLWAVACRRDAQLRAPATLRWLLRPDDDTLAAGLAPGEIVLWMAEVTSSQVKDTSTGHLLSLDAAAARLVPDETERLLRFVHDDDRRSYAAAHGGARMLLGRVRRQSPDALRFSTSPHGKPVLSPPVPALDFSLSHARGVVAVAAARQAVGIDVEPLREIEGMDGMSDIVLSAQEQANLRRAPNALKPGLFLRYWTLKEALLKAAGVGFAIAPNLLTLDAGAAPALLSAPAELGDPASWQLIAPALQTIMF